MSRPKRRMLPFAIAGLALALAAGAGAVVRYTIFPIAPDDEAHLAGTKIYCQNRPIVGPPNPHQQLGKDRFFCYRELGDLGGEEFGVTIGRFGVIVYHYRGRIGSAPTMVGRYCNPGSPKCYETFSPPPRRKH